MADEGMNSTDQQSDPDRDRHFPYSYRYQGLPAGSPVLVSSLPSDELKWTLDQMVSAGEISLDGKRRKAGGRRY